MSTMKATTLQRTCSVRSSVAVRPRVSSRRTVAVKAKYGDDSKFFDLKDPENTTGAWDMYGSDDKKRYPDIQVKFFAQASEVLTKREALRGFIALLGVAGITTWGALGAKDIDLPITKGPQTAGENGKGGSVRGRL